MRKVLQATLSITLLWTTVSSAEPTYIQKMDGLPAICSIEAIEQQTKVWDAERKYGEGSKRWSDAFHQRLRVVRECVDNAKEKGKTLYRAEVDLRPSLKKELAYMYVSWLGYLDHLIEDDRDIHECRYELSANQLKA